jgi:cold shock CspA family protein
MVVVGLLGLGLGTFAVTGARAESGSSGATSPGATSGSRMATDNPVAFEQEEVVSAPFTVESIDRAGRRVVVQSPDGARSTVNVSPNAPGLDTLKKGDQVELDYYKSSVVSLAPSGASAGPAATLNRTATGTPPATPAGPTGSHQVTTSAQVTYVDNAKGTIEITTPDGRPQTLFVQDPAIRKQMRSLHPGDRVTATYSEPMAVGLKRAAAVK